MKKLWHWLPACPGVRKITALLLLTRGLLYVLGLAGGSAVLPYRAWVNMGTSTWVYGVLLTIAGVALLVTMSSRRSMIGRIVAVYSATLMAFLAGGVFYDSRIQFSTYAILAIAMVREAAVSEVDDARSQDDSK